MLSTASSVFMHGRNTQHIIRVPRFSGGHGSFVTGPVARSIALTFRFFHFTLPKWYSVFDDSPPLKRVGSGNL